MDDKSLMKARILRAMYSMSVLVHQEKKINRSSFSSSSVRLLRRRHSFQAFLDHSAREEEREPLSHTRLRNVGRSRTEHLRGSEGACPINQSRRLAVVIAPSVEEEEGRRTVGGRQGEKEEGKAMNSGWQSHRRHLTTVPEEPLGKEKEEGDPHPVERHLSGFDP